MISKNQEKVHHKEDSFLKDTLWCLMAIVTSAMTMVTKPSITELMTKSRQEEVKVGFSFSVTIAIIMVILQNIAGCKDKFKFGEESKFNRMTWTTIILPKYGG